MRNKGRIQPEVVALPMVYPWLIGILLIAACGRDKQVKSSTDELKPPYMAPATVFIETATPAPRVHLYTVPPPRVVQVPKTSGGSYSVRTENGVERIALKPPTVVEAKYPQAHFTNFDTEQGLALSSVTSGVLDKKGQLWFGTFGGVSRYDGTGFTNFTEEHGLAHLAIRCISEDSNGNIWIGTEGRGVSRFDGVSFNNYTTSHGLVDNFVVSILKDRNGILWFGTLNGGVSRYDPGKDEVGFTTIDTSNGLPMNNISAIIEDKNGNIWFGTYGEGICRYNPTRGKADFTVFNSKHGLANNFIWSMAEDKTGNLWFGTEAGVSRFDPKAEGSLFTTFTMADGLPHNTVSCIAEDNDGYLWFATLDGVSRYDGENFTCLKTDQGLANNIVASITKDAHGNLWFGTMGGGLSRYNGKSFHSFTSFHGLPRSLAMIITQDNTGNLWFGSWGGGVSKYDGKSFINFTTNQGLGHNVVYSIFQDNIGNLWFGTMGGGVSRYDGKSFSTFTTTQGLCDNVVSNIAQDKTGNLWYATNAGISCFDGKSFTTYTTLQGLAHNNVRSIEEGPDGDLWFGTFGGGASSFDGKYFKTFTTTHGLAHNEVQYITRDKSGNLWFATSRGVSRYDGSGFISFTSRDGLTHDLVYKIVEDEEGVLWFGTTKGFSALKFNTGAPGDKSDKIIGAGLLKESNQEIQTYQPVWEIYNTETGFPVKDLNAHAMCFTKRKLPYGNAQDVGVIWGGCGDDKVVRFDPKAVKIHAVPPEVFIRTVRIDESDINWYSLIQAERDSTVTAQQEAMIYGKFLSVHVRDSLYNKFRNIQFDRITPFYPLPQNLVLPYRHNRISFDFGAIETNRNFLVRYQYFLEGYDKEWSPLSQKTTASFGNIREGVYTFKLKARSPEGNWSEILEYQFKVLPPLWRSWWAYTAYGFCILLMTWRLHLFQKARTIRIERENTQKRELEQAKEIEKAYTELKTTQNQLIQREKMASLGELTAGIAHEIKNPLNFVNNFSDLNKELVEEMQSELSAGNYASATAIASDIAENAEKIVHHGKRADAIVKSMLQHSRTSTGKKELTDINVLADEYLRLAYHGLRAKDKTFNAEFHTDLDTTIPKIEVIPQDIGRVLLNLINNAFQACSELANLKRLTLTDSLQSPSGQAVNGNPPEASGQKLDAYHPTVIVSTQNLGNKIEIRVQDNGPGIPDAIKDKIFHPFFTTKPTGQGTGLGLSLSYDIIRAHGGEIHVHSEEHEGTEFIIYLSISN